MSDRNKGDDCPFHLTFSQITQKLLDIVTTLHYNRIKQRERQGGPTASGDCVSRRCRHGYQRRRVSPMG